MMLTLDAGTTIAEDFFDRLDRGRDSIIKSIVGDLFDVGYYVLL